MWGCDTDRCLAFVNSVKSLPEFAVHSISRTTVFHVVGYSTIKANHRSCLEPTEPVTDSPCFLLGININFIIFYSRTVHLDIRVFIYQLMHKIVALKII
jgi:hypothetical protein